MPTNKNLHTLLFSWGLGTSKHCWATIFSLVDGETGTTPTSEFRKKNKSFILDFEEHPGRSTNGSPKGRLLEEGKRAGAAETGLEFGLGIDPFPLLQDDDAPMWLEVGHIQDCTKSFKASMAFGNFCLPPPALAHSCTLVPHGFDKQHHTC